MNNKTKKHRKNSINERRNERNTRNKGTNRDTRNMRNNRNTRNKRNPIKKELELKNNFYHYVNKTWVTNTYVSKDTSYKSLFTILQKSVDKDVLKTVKKYLFQNSSPNAKRCQTLYTALTNWNDVKVETITYLYIKQINEYRKNDNINSLYSFLTWALYNGIKTPINFTLSHDIKIPKKYIATIGESGLSFSIKEMYLNKDKNYTNIRNAFKSFISYLFSLFFGENHCYSSDDVFDIEMDMAQNMYDINELDSTVKTYNSYNNKTAKTNYNFDADLFFKHFNINNVNHVNLSNPKFVKHAFTVMKKEWTTNKWTSYWIFRLLIYVSNFHSRLHTFVFDFFTNKLNNTRKKENVVMNAAYNVSSIMNTTVSKMYIKYYKNEKEIEYVTDLIEKIKKEFKSRITKNAWLSQVTKEKALLKIDKLTCVIGYKEKWIDDPDCDFVPDDAIGNNVKYLKWVYNNYNHKLNNDIPNKKYWVDSDDMTVYSANAFYNNVKNEFILPNAILQKPFVDVTRNLPYNLAYIGFIIAHEMVHGFDTEGSLFDENGIMNYWWTEEDKTHYKQLQNDVIDHYEALAKKDGIKVDGKLTLDENIADISALHIIEDTLESYLIENNIFGEKQNSYFKELYYNFARQWRSLVKPKQLKTLLLLDQHSLSKYRVNCVLMRSKRFAKIFDINHSDGMYYDRKLNEIW
jgi:predicted metalloendopeptidase